MDILDFQAGMSIEGKDFLIEGREVRPTKKGTEFLKLNLMDKTGTISANIWNYTELEFGWITEGSVVLVSGAIETYNDAPQLKISSIHKSLKLPQDFAITTKFDVEAMWTNLVKVVEGFTEPLTKYVAEEILLNQLNIIEMFKKAPAAKKLHSAYYGGLIEHVWNMMQLATYIVRHYRTNFTKKISEDKVYFGVLLHDLGKIIEFDLGTPALQYTPRSQLTDHIFLGAAWVWEASNKYPNRAQIEDFRLEQAQLMHLIASHHGKPEWGGPKPVTIEGVILHAIDKIDASVMHAISLIEGKPGSIKGFSEKSFSENISYFQPKE